MDAPHPSLIPWLDVIIKGSAALGVAGAALTLAWGLWKPVKRGFRAISRAFHLSDKFHELFGVSPAQSILDRFSGLELRLSREEMVNELERQHYSFAVYICDKDGSCTFVNAALLRLFRLSLSEALGHGWSRILRDDEKERIVTAWETSIRMSIPYEAHYTVHGTPCVTRAVPLMVDGKISGYIGYVVAEKAAPPDIL